MRAARIALFRYIRDSAAGRDKGCLALGEDINVLRDPGGRFTHTPFPIHPPSLQEALHSGPLPKHPIAEATLDKRRSLHDAMQAAPVPHARPLGHHRPHSTDNRRKPVTPTPWQAPITHTHAWVLNQGFNSSTSSLSHKQPRYPKDVWASEEWMENPVYHVSRDSDVPILPARTHHAEPSHPHRPGTRPRHDPPTTPRGAAHWDEMMYRYELDAERWMRREEQSRRLAEERLRARNRLHEELRVLDEQIRLGRHEQRRVYEASRARAMAELREQEHKFRSRLEKGMAKSWEKYESRWAELTSSSEALAFANIPWPTVAPPRTVEDLSTSAISAFLLSGAHSQDVSKKERIRSAQLRWHPDRFRRLMGRVADDEKAAVEEGVGAVAGVLNDLMKREKGSSR